MTLSSPLAPPVDIPLEKPDTISRYRAVRHLSEALCQPLEIEDYGVQAMADVSPPKWHLAHTTWFFETFLLRPYLESYPEFHPGYGYLFNSYYEAVGDRHPRAQRGLLSRPTVNEVYQYRAHVDEAMERLLRDRAGHPAVAKLTTLGLHHEQQHQELLLTDLKYNLAINPLRPAYRQDVAVAQCACSTPLEFVEFSGGLYDIGHQATGFSFDNEGPTHPVYLQDFALANRLVTNGEYLEFMADKGYQTAAHWLAEGWAMVQSEGWQAPLYWEQRDGQWWIFTLGGLQPVNLMEPVCHLSYFEADAFAQWRGCRLPTEAEWEVAASGASIQGNLLAADHLHPQPASKSQKLQQLYGDVWEWTQSAYLPYPGFRPAPGAVGEYNGKFMCNQMVLRGGSCVTPHGHIRPSYRNFFPPSARWQFSGLRLAREF
ncbi:MULTISPECIES: ergothioneine biosynthesis protein EgtB [Cyanophyceae]|uniref:ergothioneine biosynthesis protein EgtB n=1 Tax=Cyanophyceae TaxID=3028117 RepID=UPI001681CF4B|nr:MULTISPECIES: ergothioneine biosynthesis protein EgtB [Cyanophyceae]MBD1916715.1 ergothioneine biosynthesis protein EgtB [Phormidium sp. FACHB-77]MBD2029345.1 ergothioneine biosynthesis protein EgtB [Phormidium sp. FACHB-322]MBD2051920.1 ergothioneine biosynthesis protein EgtB [Leptolyngbya sp. FACHB-60]